MSSVAEQRSEMPSGTHVILNRRSLRHGNEHLVPYLREGMDVLDVGCGTGAITIGITELVGDSGSVTGLDRNEPLIRRAEKEFGHVPNLSFVVDDVMTHVPSKKYDLITTARTLQWLQHPERAIDRMATWLKPGGRLFVLDYNHRQIQWDPAPPASMQRFYQGFLDWREDAGMNNSISEEMPGFFKQVGLTEVISSDASESTTKDQSNFMEAAGIWGEVATTRGVQIVTDGFLTEEERLQAIHDYDGWLKRDGLAMTMHLTYTTGIRHK